MKKVLLGTTALVAAGLVSGAAMAQSKSEPVRLVVGGYYTAAFGWIVDEDEQLTSRNRRDHAVKQDVEFHVKGETKLDNGLIVGAIMEVEGQEQAGDQVDETWAYLKGGWGEFRFGDEDDARKIKGVVAPTATGGRLGAPSPLISFSNNPIGTNASINNIENDSTKLIYFTPNFAGFQLVASYAPDGTQDTRGGAANPTTNNAGQASYAWSVGASYDAKFGGVGVLIGGGFSHGNAEASGAEPEGYSAGVNLSFGPVTVGGSYAQFEDLNGIGSEQTLYTFGGVYSMGPFKVGLSWSRGNYEGTLAGDGEPTLDWIVLDTSYQIGPGIFLEGAVQYTSYDGDDSVGTGIPNNGGSGVGYADDYEGIAIVIGTRINF